MFKIIGADGREYGPVSSEQLRQWAREGRANAQTRVQPEGQTDWTPLGLLAEFDDVLGRRPDNQPPVGAHSPLPADVLTRGYHLDLGLCFTRGAELLKQQFGVVVGAAAVFLLIQGGLQGLGAIPFIGPVFSIASLFVLGQLLGGLYLVLLKSIRGQTTDLNDLFLGFKTAYIQLLLCYVIVAMVTGLAALPGVLLVGIPIAVMIHKEQADALLIALSCVGVVVFLAPIIYLSVIWGFSLPLVIDKGLGFWQAMETSRKVVHQHWFSVFLLMLVVVLLNFVGLLICCVGLFLSVPLGMAMSMYAYETMFSPREGRSA
jgi:uncharacterized membrane protein